MSERLVIVDGYNLILRTPQLKPGDGRTLAEAREKLENLLSWAMGPEVKFLIVYDGREGLSKGPRLGRVETRFSKPPATADDLIRTLVEERVEKSEHLTVVTSDLEVARHARAMGADIALSDLFLASALGAPGSAETPEKPATLTRKELEEWVELFRKRGGGDPDGDI
ncbi:MAG TPA: NYN domain-containing protein [Candidatus Sulfotelmatobacter sp.]|nr:NYN domain-containing protein [Candidatus Sulfotelmatobacter sp.]